MIMGYWYSESQQINTWIETQGLTNTICDLHRYTDAPITYQQSKYCPINDTYCSARLAENQGSFLSLGIPVRDHRDLWNEINENMLLDFRQHDIIPPMARNLHLGDTRAIKKFNEKLHASFVKHDIYQNIHQVHNRDIFPLPTYLSRPLKLGELITRLMYAVDKNCRRKIQVL